MHHIQTNRNISARKLQFTEERQGRLDGSEEMPLNIPPFWRHLEQKKAAMRIGSRDGKQGRRGWLKPPQKGAEDARHQAINE